MNHFRKKITLSVLLLAGCAVNRVDDVNSPDDAESMYKVPVVYGIGIKEDSLPLSGSAASLMEYDPETKKGTATCLGSADVISLSFGMSWTPKTGQIWA